MRIGRALGAVYLTALAGPLSGKAAAQWTTQLWVDLVQMPVAVARLDLAGVPHSDLRLLVPSLNTRGISPALFIESVRGIRLLDGWDSGRENRETPGMGSYVRRLHDVGLRGPQLAGAIQRPNAGHASRTQKPAWIRRLLEGLSALGRRERDACPFRGTVAWERRPRGSTRPRSVVLERDRPAVPERPRPVVLERERTMNRRTRRTRSRTIAVAVAALCAVTWACRESRPEAELPDGPAVGVVELGRIGGRIYNEPQRAREILEASGMTPEEFEEQVRSVTNDPLLAREYTRGFEAVIRPRPQPPAGVGTGGGPDTVGGRAGEP